MPESFGARLRQRREEQQIALSSIAEQTKIKQSLLDALERDDVSHWPCGIYRRAYVRAYARTIGLDPDIVVREFLQVHPEPDAVAAAAELAASGLDGRRPNTRPPTRLRTIMGSALGSLARLGRSAAAEESEIAGGGMVDVPPAFEPEVRVAAQSEPEPGVVERVDVPAAATPQKAVRSSHPDLSAVAQLCTDFGRVRSAEDVKPLLARAARILDATGLIVWLWDPWCQELRLALAHGYSDKVLGQLPSVRRDEDNATAAAFRSVQPCAISANDQDSGALVVPLVTPEGCAGVLAIELQYGSDETAPVSAVAAIVAALLAQLVGRSQPVHVAAAVEGIGVPEEVTLPMLHTSVR